MGNVGTNLGISFSVFYDVDASLGYCLPRLPDFLIRKPCVCHIHYFSDIQVPHGNMQSHYYRSTLNQQS